MCNHSIDFFVSSRRLCLGETEAIGFPVSFHESHKSIPCFWTGHDIGGFNGLWFSIGESSIDIGRWNFSLFINHEHSCNFTLTLCWGIKDIGVDKLKGGHTTTSIPSSRQFDIGNHLFIQATNKLNCCVKFRHGRYGISAIRQGTRSDCKSWNDRGKRQCVGKDGKGLHDGWIRYDRGNEQGSKVAEQDFYEQLCQMKGMRTEWRLPCTMLANWCHLPKGLTQLVGRSVQVQGVSESSQDMLRGLAWFAKSQVRLTFWVRSTMLHTFIMIFGNILSSRFFRFNTLKGWANEENWRCHFKDLLSSCFTCNAY